MPESKKHHITFTLEPNSPSNLTREEKMQLIKMVDRLLLTGQKLKIGYAEVPIASAAS